MQFSEFGDPSGQLVVYFHGVPGSIEECAVFDESAKQNRLRFVCFDRFSLEKNLHGNDYYQAIADAIKEQAGGKLFDVVGFSIGCHVALKVSVLVVEQVRQMHLVSAAAPLQGADYLNDMAGKVVFKLAIHYPMVFTALSFWQSLLCRVSPRVLFAMIFGSAKGKDKQLAEDPEFKMLIDQILQHSYSKNLKGYKRDVGEYVQPWQGVLTRCEAQTTLWHGTEDNWSPVEMSEQLRQALPNCAEVHTIEAASHYSCLMQSSDGICRALLSRS